MKRVPTPPPPPTPPVIVEEVAETSEELPELKEIVEPIEEPSTIEEVVQLMTVLHSRPASPAENPLPSIFNPPLVIVSAATDTVETTDTPTMNSPEKEHDAVILAPLPAPQKQQPSNQATRERKIPRAPMKPFQRRKDKR